MSNSLLTDSLLLDTPQCFLGALRRGNGRLKDYLCLVKMKEKKRVLVKKGPVYCMKRERKYFWSRSSIKKPLFSDMVAGKKSEHCLASAWKVFVRVQKIKVAKHQIK